MHSNNQYLCIMTNKNNELKFIYMHTYYFFIFNIILEQSFTIFKELFKA